MVERNQKAVFLCGLIAALFSLVDAPRSSAEGATDLFALPKATHAKSIAADPRGGIVFSGVQVSSDASKAVIGRVTGDGQVSELVLPPKRSAGKIIEGTDGNIWFAETYENRRGYPVGRIGRILPSGEFSEYQLGNNVGGVNSIATGPDGNIWFTTSYWTYGHHHHAIGRMTTSGTVTRFALSPRSQPGAIITGPDGNLWFTERGAGAPGIGRITPTGRITRFPLRSKDRHPRSITVGPDGNLWFTEGYLYYPRRLGNKVGRITSSGVITEFAVPGKAGTEAIAAGQAGNIWFVTRWASDRAEIDSITPKGKLAEPTCLEDTCALVPSSLAMDPEGALWFSAGKEPSSIGGGGSVINEGNQIAQEAGFVGKLFPHQ